jgi:fatty acid desaturase
MPPSPEVNLQSPRDYDDLEKNNSLNLQFEKKISSFISGGSSGNDVFTRIHGSWYDLRRFSSFHPGGPIALQLSYGRDSTLLFHSHHPFTDPVKLGAMLQSMKASPEAQARLNKEFPEALIPLPEGFEFDIRHAASSLGLSSIETRMDPFEAELKQLYRSYFEEESKRRNVSFREASKCVPERWLISILLGFAAIFLGVIPMVNGYIPGIIIAPTLVWVWQVNYFHDAAHFSVSTDWRVNAFWSYLAPWFSSPFEWYHQHVIGHHIFTNIPDRDPDLYHSRLVWRFQHRDLWIPVHAAMYYLTLVFWSVATSSLAFVRPITTTITKDYNKCVRIWRTSVLRYAVHFIGRILTAALVFLWPLLAFEGKNYPLSKILAFSIIPNIIFSLWFMLCSQVNHHSDETSEAHDSNWYRHQVVTSQNVAPESFFAFIISGGLNLQIEHHLFPMVNHWHLIKLQPHVQALCVKHGVHYTRSESFLEAVIKIWSHMSIMKKKPTRIESFLSVLQEWNAPMWQPRRKHVVSKIGR